MYFFNKKSLDLSVLRIKFIKIPILWKLYSICLPAWFSLTIAKTAQL